MTSPEPETSIGIVTDATRNVRRGLKADPLAEKIMTMAIWVPVLAFYALAVWVATIWTP